MKIRLSWDEGREFYYCSVSIGKTRDDLSMVGTLKLFKDEAEAFRLVVRGGIDPRSGIDGIFESGWHDD